MNTCPCCDENGHQPNGRTCQFCAGSRLNPFAPLPAVIKELWGYLIGLQEHGEGRRRDDSPFPRWCADDVAWRAGWARAERDAIADARREKLEAERMAGELV